ncbi:MAG: hypothetical protein AAGB22_14085, partial [Bacteroidota bacterium]
MVMMVPKFKQQSVQLLIVFPVLYIVFIAAIRKGIEPRYLVSIYPWFVLYASYVLGALIQRIGWIQRPVERISGWLAR